MPREVEAVRRALRTTFARLPDVFTPGTRLVVGFSGGQDSTCLLHALAHAHRGLNLLAVHVDHGLRPASAADAERARAHAQAMGLDCEVARVDVSEVPSTSAGDAVQYVVVGTVLYEPVLLALRRLAQQYVFTSAH